MTTTKITAFIFSACLGFLLLFSADAYGTNPLTDKGKGKKVPKKVLSEDIDGDTNVLIRGVRKKVGDVGKDVVYDCVWPRKKVCFAFSVPADPSKGDIKVQGFDENEKVVEEFNVSGFQILDKNPAEDKTGFVRIQFYKTK